MSWTPEQSAIRITPQIEAELKKSATVDEMKAVMARAAEDQGLVTRDVFNPSLLHATALADAAPKKFGKYLTINGQKHYLESDSPEGLAQEEANFYVELFGKKGDTNGATEQPRDSQGRFVEQRQQATDPSTQAIDAAVEDYLVRQGIDPSALKAVSAVRADEDSFQDAWRTAAEDFRRSPLSAGWIPSERNTQIINEIIAANGLEDSPSVETIAQAVAFAKQQGLLIDEAKIGGAKSQREIDEAIGYGRGRAAASGFFGGR